ncbi:response regulator [Streptococcus gallolyticus]|uniref:Response regulator n=1 Tax=Streptococcus gallolyticus TaxID=315405 RepID=A0AA94M0J6_9STRE|nr:response regulator transcription factor [Streptococcus gallolyticus]AQP41302.1 DNA-binding response regulator [Streptococcus gallolyticus subsp. gallolyticus DSM 16831]SQG78582.1 response regulator [Streptococcus gallolyticus]
MTFKIGIIEDDSDLAAIVKEYLVRYDFEVCICKDFKTIDLFVEDYNPNLILLDINIPYYDGFYWCNEIRKITNVPIIFTSARAEDADQIRAIVSGGDDYVIKPFSHELLLAKINSQLRRAYGEYARSETEIDCGDCTFNKHRFTIKCKNNQIDLSKNEAILIELLFNHHPNIITREKLLSEIWDNELFVEENTLNETISRVKDSLIKIGKNTILLTTTYEGILVEKIASIQEGILCCEMKGKYGWTGVATKSFYKR